MGLKKWWCVTIFVYDDDTTTAEITGSRRARSRPRGSYRSTRTRDIYTRWYHTYAAALDAVQAAADEK